MFVPKLLLVVLAMTCLSQPTAARHLSSKYLDRLFALLEKRASLEERAPSCGHEAKFNNEQIQESLATHNELRASEGAANMAKLEWSDVLARRAQQLVDGCKFKHDFYTDCEGRRIGQNILYKSLWSGYPALDISAAITDMWYNEKNDFNFAANTCGNGGCGHYTQIVWAKTTHVGCASAKCPGMRRSRGNVVYFVCNYSPAGNYNNESPFIKGTPCTKCEVKDAKCEDKLCV